MECLPSLLLIIPLVVPLIKLLSSSEGKRSACKLTEILEHNKSKEVLRSIAEDVDLSEDEWIRLGL